MLPTFLSGRTNVLHDSYLPIFMMAGIAFLFLTSCLTIVWYRLRKHQNEGKQLRRDLAGMEMIYADAPLVWQLSAAISVISELINCLRKSMG